LFGSMGNLGEKLSIDTKDSDLVKAMMKDLK
jgi:hypothetical protein